jgi:Tfp pilus assembly protein PilF
MAVDRINQLKEFLKEDPEDPFNHYVLALEYVKNGHTDDAHKVFEHLLNMHPSYLPSYYHFGKLLESTGQNTEAKRIFSEGIDLAVKQGAHKTAAELRSAVDFLD